MRPSTSPPSARPPSGSRFRHVGRPDETSERMLDLGRLLFGLTVVALGTLFLLESADVLDAGRAIGRGWPVLLVAAGVLTLFERPPSVFRGTVLTAAGVVLLLFTTDVLSDSAWDYVWPAALVVAGGAVIARWYGGPIRAGTQDEDSVRATAVFGGQNVVSSSQDFRGAWLTAAFGGITLDLRNARPAADGASVNVTVAFGGIDILVPKGWRLSVRCTPIFGGAEDKTDHSEPPPPDAPTLRIDAIAAFGGVEIKHEK